MIESLYLKPWSLMVLAIFLHELDKQRISISCISLFEMLSRIAPPNILAKSFFSQIISDTPNPI